MAHTEHSQVTNRLKQVLPADATWLCPCRCVAPEIAVSRFDDGDIRYCFACLQAGYACRMDHASRTGCDLCDAGNVSLGDNPEVQWNADGRMFVRCRRPRGDA